MRQGLLSLPVNCIFWQMRTLNWLVTASKLYGKRHHIAVPSELIGICYTVTSPFWGSETTNGRANTVVGIRQEITGQWSLLVGHGEMMSQIALKKHILLL